MARKSWLLALGCQIVACRIALAQLPCAPGDWPGWRGPDRTGVSTVTGLLPSWPPGGPKLLWKATGMGGGYSTPSVAGGRVFLMGSQGNDEFVLALDAATGKQLWSTRVGIVGVNTGPNYPGPRATPTVDGPWLYTLGSDGDLVCVEAANGHVRWHRHLGKDFHGKRGTWAYTESPLIDGDVLVCTPGGPTATMVALNKSDGSVRWKTELDYGNTAAYASAIVAHVGGVKQYVQFLGSGLLAVSAQDGKILWRYKKNIGFASCATPIFHDDCIYSSASGNEGAGGDALLRLSPSPNGIEAKQVYLVRGILNFHGGVVRVGNELYGTNANVLICQDFKTGAVRWKDRSVGQASIVAADHRLYLRGEEGSVALVDIDPTGYHERGRFRQPERTAFATFAHPVVAGGRLYLRDADLLFCYDIKAP